MCGIAGFYGKNAEKARILSDSLAHRGPDDSGVFETDILTLVHRRLAILDISGGKQPMTRNSLTIVFNGEIYNHLELRKLCDANFGTHSDTETLLFLYEKFGEKMIEKLDGMFAFAIYNSNDRTLFLARDRYGKKPLFFTFQNGFAFASELNALAKISKLTINDQAIEAFLGLGIVPFENTIYKDIFRLNAAEWIKIKLDSFEVESGKYFSSALIYQSPLDIDENSALEMVENALKNSVKSRLESSDVEVGSFLSGGIDSSLVSFYAAKEHEGLKTFTVRFAGAFDESPLAEATAKAIGSVHTTIDIAPNLAHDIESIIAQYGEPFFDSSAIPSYYVAKAARERVKVVLNGDGADELFAGYRRFVPIANGWFSIAKKFACLAQILPKPKRKISGYNYLYRLLESARSKTPLEFWRKTRAAIPLPLRSSNEFAIKVENYLTTLPNISPLSLALLTDQELLLFSDLLPKMDIATMAHSLEARSPFLSRELSMLVPRLDDRYKIRRTSTKYLLRKLAKIRLGNAVANAPKRGFEVPLANWVENELKEVINDRVFAPNAFWKNYIDPKLLDAPLSREEKAKALWSLFCLEVWRNRTGRIAQ